MFFWIKLAGGALLALTGVVGAISLRLYNHRRIDTLDGFVALIFYIKGQVDCFARPIGDILYSLPPEILRQCNCPKGALTLEDLIEESRIYLDAESLRLISAFASEFGSIFRDEQTKRCDYYANMLDGIRNRLSDKAEGESRSGGAICICVALGIAILLW